MRKFLRYILPVALVLGAIVFVVGLATLSNSKRPEKSQEPDKAILVDVIPASKESQFLSIVSQGTVRARTETTLVAEVPGKIVSVSQNFVAGGFFRENEVLLQIDPSDYQAALKRAHANLASKKAQYADQKARSEQAMKDWKNLGRKGEPSDLTLRKPQLAEALAGVQAAEADLLKAERDLARTRISLPYDGLVRAKNVDVGQYVGTGAQMGATFAIGTAEVRLPLSSRDVAFIRLPSATKLEDSVRPEVQLSAESSGLSGHWRAEIVRTEGVVDEASRVIYAVAEIKDPYAVLGENTQNVLRVGTFVRAEIQGLRVDNVVVLPRSVLRPDNTILVANRERRLEIRQVDVLRAEPQVVYISSGISEGDQIITTSMDAPISGTLLKINDESLPDTPAASDTSQMTIASE
jgi:RND family efflux transporter MFP subunit